LVRLSTLVLCLAAIGLAACTPSSGDTSTSLPASSTTALLSTTTTKEVTAQSSTLAPWAPPDHPIQIIDDQFVDTRTGEVFVLRGTNYLTRVPVGVGYQDRTFSPLVFDREAVAADFDSLADRGYNTVRIFLDSCSSGAGCIGNLNIGGLSGAYLDVIVEVMDLARIHGLFLVLTSGDLPDDGGYWEISSEDDAGLYPGYRNSHYMTESGEAAAQLYWSDLLGGLADRRAPFETVLGWSILNEQWMFKDQYPLAEGSGVVTTKTGTYNTDDPIAKRDMVADGVRSYIAAVADVIRGFDPHGLVTMGFFAPQFPNPTGIGGSWYVDTASLVQDSALDFFDFHAYPGEDITLTQIAENFGLPADKPVIMGEYGAFVDRYPDSNGAAVAVQGWTAESCNLGWHGWLYWEMLPADVSVGDATWSLIAEDGLLLDGLSPAHQPDPCTATLVDPNIALGSATVASRSLTEEPPENAVDGNPSSQWGSGADATQWIEIDLGAPKEIGGLRLLVAQFPEGPTVHVVTVDGVEISRLDSTTAGGDLVAFTLHTPVVGQVVRVTTTQSPSWVAWSEIEVLAP
jgi:hypothetical protein